MKDNEDNRQNQLPASQVYAARHHLPAPAGDGLCRVRPVQHPGGRHAGQKPADDGVPEPRTARREDTRRRRHRREVREHAEGMGKN